MIDMKGLPSDLDEETLKARGLAEIMRILYAASCNGRAAGITFEDIATGLYLFWEMFDDHTKRLNTLTQTAYSIKEI